MESLKLETLIEKENITLIDYNMKNTKARIINYNDVYIFMDHNQIDTQSEEMCLLAEELGHYYYSSYYTLLSDQNYINRQEYKSKKYAYNILIPFQKLKSAILRRL